MSDVMTFSKRTAAGLEEVLRTLLLDSENKVPAERLRIVGALSDGAIIEQGSNANGEYVRFANGLQICQKTFSSTEGTFSGTIEITTHSNGWYNSPQVQWTFPASFASNARTCFCSGVYSTEGNYVRIIGIAYAGARTVCYYNFIAPMAITLRNDIFFALGAIGKWK